MYDVIFIKKLKKVISLYTSQTTTVLSMSVPTVVNLAGNPIATISILRTAYDQMRVCADGLLFEVLGIVDSTPQGGDCVVVEYNENTVPTGAVQQQFCIFTLLPWESIRFGGTVAHIREHHPAMQDVMILDQTADRCLKWVPLRSIERNGQMLTARFGSSSIDIKI
jgi:hypothetical protein